MEKLPYLDKTIWNSLKVCKKILTQNSLNKGIWASLDIGLAKPGLKKARKASQFSKR